MRNVLKENRAPMGTKCSPFLVCEFVCSDLFRCDVAVLRSMQLCHLNCILRIMSAKIYDKKAYFCMRLRIKINDYYNKTIISSLCVCGRDVCWNARRK